VILNLVIDAFEARGKAWCKVQDSGCRVQGVYELKLKVRIKSDNGKVMNDIEDNMPGLMLSLSNECKGTWRKH